MFRMLFVLPALGGCLLQSKLDEVGPLNGEVEVVRVRSGNGTVTVTAGNTLSVTRSAEYSSPGFEMAWDLVDGALELEERCPIANLCNVDTTIVLPTGVALDIQLKSGEVWLDDISGDVSVSADGLILEGNNLNSTRLSVNAGDALITLELLAAPTELELVLDTGDTDVHVPAGPYALALDTGLGSVQTLNLLDEPGAEGSILISTGAGDITLTGDGPLPE